MKIQMPRPGWNGIRDLIMAKDGVGILHVSTGLEIDIGVMAELRDVFGESRVGIWSYCSALASSFCLLDRMQSLALSLFGGGLGQVWAPKPRLWSQPFPAQTLHQARTKNTTGVEGQEY